MKEEDDKQYKIQICKLTAKLQYLVGVVNLFTKGYANVEFCKDYDCIKFEFANNEHGWKTRYQTIKEDYIDETIYLRLRGENISEWKLKDKKYVIPKLKAAIKHLETFIEDPSKYEFENDLNWYTETIKYKVFKLDYELHMK